MENSDIPTLPNQVSSANNPPLKHHHHSCSDGDVLTAVARAFTDNKENNHTNTSCCDNNDKENSVPFGGNLNSNSKSLSSSTNGSLVLQQQKKCLSTGRVLKPSSSTLQMCMQMNEPDRAFKSNKMIWDASPCAQSDHSSSLNIWDYSDSEAAPASSWSTLPNRALLCRPLPLDVGKCTCLIVKEASTDGLGGGTLYSLYTNEGYGRQDRKLAIAHHRRHGGRSEFIIAHKMKGLVSCSDESFVGNVTANLLGSKYHIWNQNQLGSANCSKKPLLGVITFVPTIGTWTGSYRRMKAYIPKHHSMQLKNTTQVQHVNGLPNDWEERRNKVNKLHSRTPRYNNVTKQYELDFRDKGRAGLKIQSSVKNFQLTLEENGKQIILQLGRVGKSKFVMDFRYPLNGYQAFCICLASIDSKLCCAV
ncbi:unnamed protein product [Linum trigynum]|uniref:Tubby C-terminal domain-containing protein n=1 Tax=Linum trigynum TaxID=586398 RepID=A0AAV2CE27_9ROSI